MSSKERLLEFLKYNEMGQTAFEERVGLTRGYISKVKKDIGSSMVTKIAEIYPDLNVNWLVTGEGKMLKEKEGIPHTEAPMNGIPHIESVEAYCGPDKGSMFQLCVKNVPCTTFPVWKEPTLLSGQKGVA